MYRFQRNPRSAIATIANDRAYSRLINAVSSNFVLLVFAGTLTIAGGAADAVRNRGSIMAAFNEVGIDENGTDRHVYDGRVLRFISEMAAPSALSNKRVTSTAAAAYPLEEAVRIYFAHPFAAIPRETAYREKDPKALLQVFARLNGATGAEQGQKLAKVSGGVTATLSAVTVTVTHGYDRQEANRPEYIPTVRQDVLNVDAASAALPLFIKSQNAIRQLVVTQETVTDGEVSDIINSLTLIADDDVSHIGPSKMKWGDLALDSEFEFGGAVVSSNRAHLGLNFQQFGRLSSVMGPQQMNNLRFEFDCQPSVAGAGASKIRVTIVELRAEPGLVNPERTIPV